MICLTILTNYARLWVIKTRNRDIVAFAADFVSFMFQDNRVNTDDLRGVILFGSVAREDSDDESDVDIFVDIRKYSKKNEEIIRKVLSDFYEDRRRIWKLRG